MKMLLEGIQHLDDIQIQVFFTELMPWSANL